MEEAFLWPTKIQRRTRRERARRCNETFKGASTEKRGENHKITSGETHGATHAARLNSNPRPKTTASKYCRADPSFFFSPQKQSGKASAKYQLTYLKGITCGRDNPWAVVENKLQSTIRVYDREESRQRGVIQFSPPFCPSTGGMIARLKSTLAPSVSRHDFSCYWQQAVGF